MFRTATTVFTATIAALAIGATAIAPASASASQSSAPQRCQITPYVGTYMGTASDGSRIHFSVDARGDVRNFTVNGVTKLRQGYALYGCLSTAENGFNVTGTWSSRTAMTGTYWFFSGGVKKSFTYSANAYAS